MSSTIPLSPPKQYVIHNPQRATRKATWVAELLDDQLCLHKLIKTKVLEKGAEIILEPRQAFRSAVALSSR